MIDTIVNSFDIWTDAQGIKSRNRVKSVDNINLEGIASLRELILDLAIKGKLVAQSSNDEPAGVLLAEIVTEKTELIKAGKIKKINPLPEIDKNEVPYKIPDSWAWSRLGNVCTKLTDGSHNPPRDSGNGLPMLSSQNVINGKIYFENPSRYISEKDFEIEDKRTQICHQDVLLTIVGTIGRSAVVPENAPKFVLQRSVAVLQSKLNPHFLAMQLVSPHCMLYFDTHGKGTAQKGIYLGKLGLMGIVIPPLAEQNRIIAKVNELMTLCDKLEDEQFKSLKTHQALVKTLLEALTQAEDANEFQAVWERMAEHFDTLFCTEDSIEQLKQTLLQLAVMGKLVKQDPKDEPASELLKQIAKEKEKLDKAGKIKKQVPSPKNEKNENTFHLPSSWEFEKLENVCYLITDGTHQTPSYTTSGRIFISSQNIKPFKFLPKKHKWVSEDDYQNYIKNRKPELGDILLTRVGSNIGEATVINIDLEFAIYVSVGLIKPVRKYIDSNYLTIWLNSPLGRLYSEKNTYGKGVSQGNLNLNLIRNFNISIAPFEEQKRIVSKVEELFVLCDSLKDKVLKAQKLKILLSKTIIEKAV